MIVILLWLHVFHLAYPVSLFTNITLFFLFYLTFSYFSEDADKILSDEPGLLKLPGEPLSVAMIDRERSKSK